MDGLSLCSVAGGKHRQWCGYVHMYHRLGGNRSYGFDLRLDTDRVHDDATRVRPSHELDESVRYPAPPGLRVKAGSCPLHGRPSEPCSWQPPENQVASSEPTEPVPPNEFSRQTSLAGGYRTREQHDCAVAHRLPACSHWPNSAACYAKAAAIFETNVSTPPSRFRSCDRIWRAANKHWSPGRVFWHLRRSRTTSNLVVWVSKVTIHLVVFVVVGILLAIAWAGTGFVVCHVAVTQPLTGPCAVVQPPSGEVVRNMYAWLVGIGIGVGFVVYGWHFMAASSSYQDRPWRLRERFDRALRGRYPGNRPPVFGPPTTRERR